MVVLAFFFCALTPLSFRIMLIRARIGRCYLLSIFIDGATNI